MEKTIWLSHEIPMVSGPYRGTAIKDVSSSILEWVIERKLKDKSACKRELGRRAGTNPDWKC
jgi:hypothetical protein